MFDKASSDNKSDVPADILSCPALLFLYYRVEQILGIKAGIDALKTLNSYLEKNCGSSFIENPAAYENLLSSREQIYDISGFLTINETYFFREGAHFNLLVNLLPGFADLGRPVQLCCAAVSIGCEAYSIAMLLDYHQKKEGGFDFFIDAFDISSSAIDTAKNGRYTANTLRNDGSSWKHILDSYLVSDNGEYFVPQSIKRKVKFFSHNIMRGLDKQYDIIFFRNSLIYFTSRNRLFVINNLAESLINNGLLFLGVSETSSVKHPLLTNRYLSDAFYFQKTGFPNAIDVSSDADFSNQILNMTHTPAAKKNNPPASQEKNEKTVKKTSPKQDDTPVKYDEISNILHTNEGKSNALEVLDILENGNLSELSKESLAACVIYMLNMQDFINADKIISFLEKSGSGSLIRFLRAEYFFLCGIADEAEKYYNEAAVKDKYFWPAFYRIAILAAEGNRIRFEYKIKKTIESIDLCQSPEADGKFNYECFMGGFSPDYFRRILEKKLT
ncbi:MAG: chemotaxis protein CheR [Treponema sp.]|nr:chemotaxis protein CheR [Treponema sp.]